MLFKRVNGKLMVIERHFYLFFFIVIAVGMMITIAIVEANARGEDEPVCYSQACEKRMAENATSTATATEIERSTEDVQLEINDSLKNTVVLIEETEEKIVELVEKMGEYDLNMQESANEIKPARNEWNSYKHVVKKAQEDYKKAFAEATSSEGLDEAKTLRDTYDEAVIELERLEQAYEDIKLKASEDEDTYWEKKRELMELRELLEAQTVEKEDLMFDLKMSQRNSQFIVLDVSGTCKVLSKMAYENPDFTYNGNCLTVRDLMQFDTADPTISGEFVDMGYDMVREKSNYKEYWKFYEQIPNWKVITVAPSDGEMISKSTLITVSPNPVHYIKPPGAKDPTSVQGSFNQLTNERYEWYDIYIDRYCENVLVSPDIKIVQIALNQVMKDCKDPYESYIPKKTFNIWKDWTAPLPTWMDNLLDDVEDVVNEILPQPEQEPVVCYSQACQRGMDERGIPWRSP